MVSRLRTPLTTGVTLRHIPFALGLLGPLGPLGLIMGGIGLGSGLLLW